MSKSCFVISPIGDEGSETRRKADELLNYIVTPVLDTLGYETVRADKIDESGAITTQIIQKLISADLVVADLSERNPNVFYELSVRHASRKPFVQLITMGEPIPFDVAANRTIQYDLTKLAVVEAAKAQLRSQVSAIEAGNDEVENPISTAIDLSSLRTSASPSDRTLGEMLATLTEVGATIARIDQAVGSRETAKLATYKTDASRLWARLNDANSEIGRLRAVKGKIEYEALTHPFQLEPVLDSFAAVLKHINAHCVPQWDDKMADEVSTELDSIIASLSRLSGSVSEIPF